MMKGIRNWVSSHLSTHLLLSARPLTADANFLMEEPENERTENLGSMVSVIASSNESAVNYSRVENNDQMDEHHSSNSLTPEDPDKTIPYTDSKCQDEMTILEALQIKYLRLIYRLGFSSEDLVSVVLYRLQFAGLIKGSQQESREYLGVDRAKAIARELEVVGKADLAFSFRVLVLGKTGVGKSSTINSVFNQVKVRTDAFQPSTEKVQEVSGVVSGITINIIDTPGLLSSICYPRKNRKILRDVKRFLRKSPPDLVLYVDRLDGTDTGYDDYLLFKQITEVFNAAIWFNTVFVMTHSSTIPEGPDGHSISYDSFVNQRKQMLQQYVHQVVGDSQLENPLLLVENHPSCKLNREGEKVLPNGQVWRSQFLLLSISFKILRDVNAILEYQYTVQGKQTYRRLPSLPHLLSSLLQPHCAQKNQGGFDTEETESLADHEDGDEYDNLPPIRILMKDELDQLSKTQRNDYLDELEYRETLYLKKQRREEFRREAERKASNGGTSTTSGQPEGDAAQDAFVLPDIALPQGFDSDDPAYRYRHLEGDSQWVVRPVLDSQGWDHDVGLDRISLEASLIPGNNLSMLVMGQMNKDKDSFNLHSECATTYIADNGASYYAGLDVQAAGTGMLCTIRGDAKHKILKCNRLGGGVSVTSVGRSLFAGAKVTDTILINKRSQILLNVGTLAGHGEAASGGSLELLLTGRDYPARNDKATLGLTMLSYDKETVYGGSFQVEFRPVRGTNMAIEANLNSRNMGHLSFRTTSTEHVQLALLVVVPIIRSLFRKKGDASSIT